jgi:hypothetical protein
MNSFDDALINFWILAIGFVLIMGIMGHIQ